MYRDTGYSLSHLVESIKLGDIALPEIQRPFVWKSAKVRDLFDSMYRGYPVGTLMLWETGAPAGARRIGGGPEDRPPRLLIVDGQQRLTSLFAVMTGTEVITRSFVPKRITVAFRPVDEMFEVSDAAIRKDADFIPDITALWQSGYKSTVRAFFERLAEAKSEAIPHEVQDRLEERIDRVRDLRDFRFQVIELGSTADEAEVAEIFVRINSKGVQLNQADFILTLMSVNWEPGRQALEGFCRSAVDPNVKGTSARNPYLDPKPEQMLRAAIALAFRRGRLQHVYNLLRGKDMDTGAVSEKRRVEQFERLQVAQARVLDLTNWHEFLKSLAAAGFRSSRMITSATAIVYSYALWLIGKYDFGLNSRDLRQVIARWFFMAHTTGWYSSSPESTIESDLARLRGLPSDDSQAFIRALDQTISSVFTRDYWDITFPARLDTSAAHSPALYGYWAALNLLDAQLLFSTQRLRDTFDSGAAAPRSVERHHLFPKAFLARQGVTNQTQVNAIANMAFLDWPDNTEISAEDPTVYWPVFRERLTPAQREQQEYWHALPPGWDHLDFRGFLDRRRHLMARVVRDAFDTLREASVPEVADSAEDVIRLGESQTVEFKSTARYNLHTGQTDRRMEHAIVKSVAGFLNGQGGTLVIGVDDSGQVLGLASDLATTGKGDLDGFELAVRQRLESSLSAPTAATVRMDFQTVDGKDVCLVRVRPAAAPVFARGDGGSSQADQFWVRTGNATIQLRGDELMTYTSDHWG